MGEEFRSIHELKRRIVKYIHWYNHKRIKEKLNGLSPVEYRRQTA
jgi:transposase InsO family protein